MLFALSLSALLATSNGAYDDLIDSLRSASVPFETVIAGSGFDDLAPLAESLEGVEVVGMGEPTHGSREVFQMKHRMFEYLVEVHGFTVFALESSMPDSIAMDNYVLHGEGSAKSAALKQGFWTWSTQEAVDLLEWMRDYNKDVSHMKKLRVVGIDMQSQAGCTLYFQKASGQLHGDDQALFWEELSWLVPTDEQMNKFEEIVAHDLLLIREREGEHAGTMYEHIVKVFQQAVDNRLILEFNQSRLKAVPHLATTFKKVGQLLNEARDLPEDAEKGLAFLSEHSAKGVQVESIDPVAFNRYATALRRYADSQSDRAQDFVRSAELLEFFARVPGITDLDVRAHRDSSMANNLLWIRDTYLPGSKIMMWAHNYHVSRLLVNDKPMMTGAFLAESLGEKYFPVGFSFYEGGFRAVGTDGKLKAWSVPAARKGSIDEAFKRVGYSQFFIDFGQLDETGRKWASQLHSTRNYGAVNNEAQADSYWGEITPGQMYAGMIFIAKTKPARAID